jgi:hypothetical protein
MGHRAALKSILSQDSSYHFQTLIPMHHRSVNVCYTEYSSSSTEPKRDGELNKEGEYFESFKNVRNMTSAFIPHTNYFALFDI